MQGSVMSDKAGSEGVEQTLEEQSREYLTFRLDEEEYAVPIEQVKELRAWEPVTRVPHAEKYECGLINVRGAIVPIMDMRRRLGLKSQAYNKHTVVIMFGIQSANGKERASGAVVDALSDVVRFGDSQIQAPPQLSRKKSMKFASGVVEHKERMIVILNIEDALNNGPRIH
jgi:purine-binding chemotaxis protein CheW